MRTIYDSTGKALARSAQVDTVSIDPTKIATKLGWYPETPFKDGIIKTIKWYLENQNWVNSVTSGDYQKYYEEMYENR